MIGFMLQNIPVHARLSVSFDLLIIRSWNGNQVQWTPLSGEPAGPSWPRPPVGPDRWSLSADDVLLVETTFSNTPDHSQAFPGVYPGSDYPAWSGSAEKNSLGYVFISAPMDAVYHLEFVFPHSLDSLDLLFSGQILDELQDETWGFDNLLIKIELDL